MTKENVVLNQMVEISLGSDDDFLKIKETLNRIGISTNDSNPPKLYPSCVILHKQGKYYISHFKLMFALSGGTANLSALDIKRQYTIAQLLCSWGLCSIKDAAVQKIAVDNFDPKLVKIVPYSEAKKWQIVPKYTVGNKSQHVSYA